MRTICTFFCALTLTLAATTAMAKTKYVAPDQLDATMQSFTKALGVQCNYCHVTDRSATLKDYKWANDEEFATLRHKRVAQAMLGMQIDVNKESNVKFDCMKCHQGKKP
jgi:cytochrome c2